MYESGFRLIVEIIAWPIADKWIELKKCSVNRCMNMKNTAIQKIVSILLILDFCLLNAYPVIIIDSGKWHGHLRGRRIGFSSYAAVVWEQTGANTQNGSSAYFTPKIENEGVNTITCTYYSVPVNHSGFRNVMDTNVIRTSKERVAFYDFTQQESKMLITVAEGTGSTFPSNGYVTGTKVVNVSDKELLMAAEYAQDLSTGYSFASLNLEDDYHFLGYASLANDIKSRVLTDLAKMQEVTFNYNYYEAGYGNSLELNDNWELKGEYTVDCVLRYIRVYEDTDNDGYEECEENTKLLRVPIKNNPRFSYYFIPRLRMTAF